MYCLRLLDRDHLAAEPKRFPVGPFKTSLLIPGLADRDGSRETGKETDHRRKGCVLDQAEGSGQLLGVPYRKADRPCAKTRHRVVPALLH